MNELTENIKNFIIGGNSTFTILNDKTKVRYTFKVKKADDNNIFFVSHLNGNDNDNDYNYMGIINKFGQYKLTKNSKVKPDSTVNRAFAWMWNNRNRKFPDNFHFYHEGKCGKCGRKLTTPESIERGFGPFCFKTLNN